VALALRPRPLVAIDLPGHGHSDGPGPAQRAGAAVTGAATDVAVVIEHLAPHAAAVVGMSFGGLTAIALAGMAPHLVRKLVLVDIVPGIERDHARHIVEFVSGPPTFAGFDELLARTMKFNPTRSESSLRRGILHNAVQLDDGTWVWRHSRWRLDEESQVSGPAGVDDDNGGDTIFEDQLATLERIDVPILLARGLRQDSILRDEDEAELLRRQPTAHVVHFADAGHSIQGDSPVHLAAVIDEFAR
jgi:pimeloyl-ACP methyl ester carboxylesterase